MAHEILPDAPTLAQLEGFAQRLAHQPGTMAHLLAHKGVTARDLGIDRRALALLSTCLTPRPENLEQDIVTIARTAGVDVDVVRQAVAG